MSSNNSSTQPEWILMKRVFPVLDINFGLPFKQDSTDEDLYQAIKFLKATNLNNTIHKLILVRIEQYLRKNVVPEFWKLFKYDNDPHEAFKRFYEAINLIYYYYKELLVIMTNAHLLDADNPKEEDPKQRLKMMIRAVLLAQFPTNSGEIIYHFYEIALQMEDEESDCRKEKNCKVCSSCWKDCVCGHYFSETNRKLVELGLVEPLVSKVLTSLVYLYIEHHVEKTSKDSFDTSHIEDLEKWLDSVILSWIKKIYFSDTVSLSEECIQSFNKKLRQYMYETYTKIRINQLFNIIIEYPESLPALEDLRTCLPKTDLRPYLTKKMQTSMETRLLHPGVSTPDILTAYVAAIRSMRVLDPSGLLLETVTQPVHQYLRSREDTIRCVVSSLTEDGPNDLAEELVRAEGIQADENNPGDEDVENWQSWVPDPIDADPAKPLTSRRTADIISMLVNVYGSKELFVNEYRTLLADRLLSQLTCDTEKEIRYLELLKLRFGDSQLHFCEVMLKDVGDSKRINHHIKQDSEYTETDIGMSAMIVSAQFWPPFKEENLQVHAKVDSQMEEYTKAFETLKGNRTLFWKKHLGIVDLEIELADRTLNLSVSPVYATIILHFQDKNTWQLDELSRVMHVPATLLRRKIGFWQSHGLIAETTPDLFHLVEEDKGNGQSPELIEDFESESVMASTQDQREEELQTFWSYIVGMLMNLDTLPLERIHQMLKMFAFQGPTLECSVQELQEFLDRKVREHQLVFTGGLYRLPL